MHRERKGRDNCLVFAILNRMVGAGLPEKVTLEERLLGGEGANHADMRGKSIPGGRHMQVQRTGGTGRTLAFTQSAMESPESV